MHDILPFSRYTDARLPPRVRSVLEGVFQAAWQVLEPALQKGLSDYEQILFRRADKAINHQQQNEQFVAMREVRKRAVEMQVAFRDSLQAGLVGLVAAQAPKPAQSSSGQVLQLVASEDLEESLILSELSAKAEMRFAATWHVLAYRFAVIAAAPPLDVELIPVGPQALADALKAAGRRLDLSVEARVDAYRHLENCLLEVLDAMLEAVNDDLIRHRILPHLLLPRPRTAPLRSPAGTEAAEVGNQAPVERSETPPSDPTDEPADAVTRPATASLPDSQPSAAPPTPIPEHPAPMSVGPFDATPSSALPAAELGPALQALEAVWQSVPETHPQAGPMHDTGDDLDQSELFETLRDLLSGRRTRQGPSPAQAAMASRPVAPAADVQGVLSVLQGQPAAPRMVDGRWQPRRVSDLKHDMLSQLRAISDGTPTRLSEEDEDTVDLVGLLFDQLGQGLSPVSHSHGLLTKLQVPVLKVALRDKRFFTQRKHPARLLLNEIAEAATLWVEDEDADRPMLDRMQLVVDRVIRDYDENDQLFDELLDDLGGHLKSVRRKAEVSEKRQIDAARGREKMDLSRAAAVEATEALLAQHDAVPEALHSFLLQAWTDVLALSLLRQGPQGEDFQHDLGQAAQLLSLHAERTAPQAQRRQAFEALARELADGVGSVGMVPDAFRPVQAALSAALGLDEPEREASAPTAAVLQQTLEARPKLGGGQGAQESPSTILSSLRGQEQWELTAEEVRMVERIKHLPFGTWFEFTRNQQGDLVRRKLSWFSPVTGRCLFVNARGAKVEDRTINMLARDLARGNARIVVQTRERLIDRAWNAILSTFSRKSDPDVAILMGDA
ncbi:MAG: DUF1631 family protein [Lysobacterales bacterium]